MTMDKSIRINIIRKMLKANKTIYISHLVTKFNVTERTIRRDIQQLVRMGIAKSFYGGINYINIDNKNYFQDMSLSDFMNKDDGKNNLQSLNRDKISSDGALYILGSFNIDIVSKLDKFPRVGETVRSLSTNFYGGGKGANQATAAARVNNNVHLMTKIGNDDLGNKAKSYLSMTDIKSITLFEDKEKNTGNAVIFISKETSNNFIAINLGANETISNSELDSELMKIKKSKVFLTQLENNFDITRRAVMFAHENKILVIMNPAPYNSNVSTILPYIDIITPNETEAEALSGIKITSIDDAKNAANLIYDQGVGIVIITLGANGVLLFDGVNYSHYPPFQSVVVDSSGAGDSFNGALAANLANNYSLDYSIKFASAFASLAIERNGASSMPSYDLVISRLSNQQ